MTRANQGLQDVDLGGEALVVLDLGFGDDLDGADGLGDLVRASHDAAVCALAELLGERRPPSSRRSRSSARWCPSLTG